jgi:predicted SAM-dependent methyltransferase
MESQALIKINLGCGPIQPEGWVNVDGSLRARLAKHLPWVDKLLVRLKLIPPTEFNTRIRTDDICKPLSFLDNSVHAVYAGWLLEHLTRDDGRRLLEECFRIMRPGGVLRVRVPDNYAFCKNYVKEFDETFVQPRASWNENHTRWTKMFFDDICIHRPWLHSMNHFHKWMYDEISLTLAFERAGFREVARRGLHDSRISDVAAVESQHEDLIVEGVKPA